MKIVKTVVLGLLAVCVNSASADLYDNGNMGFEKSEFSPWRAYAPTNAFAVELTIKRTGDQSLKIGSTYNSNNTNTPPLPSYDMVDSAPATPGYEYTMQAYYFLPTALTSFELLSVNVGFYQYDGVNTPTLVGQIHNGIAYGPEPGFPDETVIAAWTPLSVKATAPTGANLIFFGLKAQGNGSNFYFDDVSLSVVPEPSTFLLFVIPIAFLRIQRKFRGKQG
jgi:hypothetical protein